MQIVVALKEAYDLLSQLIRKRNEKLAQENQRLEAAVQNARELLRVNRERNRILRATTHILRAMEERIAPGNPDERELEARDRELTEPHDPDVKRWLEDLDRELAELPYPDLKRRLEAMNQELAELHNPGIRPREHDHFLLSDGPEGAPTFDGTDIPVRYMFDYLKHVRNIYDFLQDFPEVKIQDAISAMRDHVREELPEHIRCDRDNGEPVFWGSGTPVRHLFDHLADGRSVDRYLAPLSSSSRRQVLGTLEMASLLVEAMAYENATG